MRSGQGSGEKSLGSVLARNSWTPLKAETANLISGKVLIRTCAGYSKYE
jgi:hypothetical protein